LEASPDVSAEASPIFHSCVFTFEQRHLSTNLSHRALGVTSRDKFPREKKHSFSALSITLIAAADMKTVLACTLF